MIDVHDLWVVTRLQYMHGTRIYVRLTGGQDVYS